MSQMDIRSRVFLYAAAIRLGIVRDNSLHREGCRHFLRDVLPVIEKWPEFTAPAIAFIEDPTIGESNGYTRQTLMLSISAALDKKTLWDRFRDALRRKLGKIREHDVA